MCIMLYGNAIVQGNLEKIYYSSYMSRISYFKKDQDINNHKCKKYSITIFFIDIAFHKYVDLQYN